MTDEEKEYAGWKDNQRFEWKLQDDGSVMLSPWKEVDLGDISELPREVLEMLVLESLEQDVPVNQIVNDLLKQTLVDLKNNDITKGEIDPNFTNNDIGLPGGTKNEFILSEE
jgi:SPX domain protein involved in polyphosphate accumulation